MRRVTTWGRFNLDGICAVVVCNRQGDDDGEVSLRFSQAQQLLRSVGMDIIPAVPEDQENQRRTWRRQRVKEAQP